MNYTNITPILPNNHCILLFLQYLLNGFLWRRLILLLINAESETDNMRNFTLFLDIKATSKVIQGIPVEKIAKCKLQVNIKSLSKTDIRKIKFAISRKLSIFVKEKVLQINLYS